MKTHHKYVAIFLAIFLAQKSFAEAPKIQLANIYREGINVSQYLVSEKLDGIRARWNGYELISRGGNKINAPAWFIKDFPQEELDGELWSQRGKFEEISSIVRKEIPNDDEWKKIKFMVFDLPQDKQIFKQRVKTLKRIIEKSESQYLELIDQYEVSNHEKLIQKLYEVNKSGGEGLMLHKKTSLYQAVRSDDLLKLKAYEDEEATVVDYIKGNGRLEGKIGALWVENADKIQFGIGSGFNDEQRKNMPKIGDKITYKFYGKTKNSVPRFPVFLRIREEI
jgi:DNA ligase-1